MQKNTKLCEARRLKRGDFITRLPDIEMELNNYRPHFKGKTILCNCGDDEDSNFYQYFKMNFEVFGLTRLICTTYNPNGRAMKYEVLPGGVTRATELEGNGSYDSKEGLDLIRQADIVVTNPPFPIFKEYLQTLIDYGKSFIIIGSALAISYTKIFPLFLNNKLWWGVSPRDSAQFVDPSGKLVKVNSVWYTNITHRKREEKMVLFREYSERHYPKYDNFNCIKVQKVCDIPCDYDGVMGVPITFVGKFCPEQFEILGLTGIPGVENLYEDGFKHYDRPYLNGQRKSATIFIKNKMPRKPNDGKSESNEVSFDMFFKN